MSLKFYLDSHVAKQIAIQLRNKGVDAIHCEDADMSTASDPEHLKHATEQGRAVVTHDKHFLKHHDEWQAQEKTHAGIFFVSPRLRGKENIGIVVTALMEYYDLIEGEAGSLEDDVYNHKYYITGK